MSTAIRGLFEQSRLLTYLVKEGSLAAWREGREASPSDAAD